MGLDNGTHSSDSFLFVLLVVFFFLLHTHLLVPAKRKTTEIREDLEPGRDGPALFLCL